MSDDLYIPPQGIYFRLLGYVSQGVIYSRSHNDPEVSHYPASSPSEDQYFELLPGSGNHQGLYAIKGKVSGKVLFSRSSPDPTVYHIDGDGYYEDNWFRLEPGSGRLAKQFRLITPAAGMTIYSRPHPEPSFSNYPQQAVSDDQYFSFLFEDMNIDRIDYDINLGKILTSEPIVLANQTLTNDSDQDQTMTFTVNQTVTHTSSFDYTLGFTISVSQSIKAGVPLVVDASITVSETLSNTLHWGQTDSFSQQYSATFPVKAGPYETMRAVSTVNKGNLEVPFTIHLSSKSTGATTETKGVWRGVSSWDLRHTITKE